MTEQTERRGVRQIELADWNLLLGALRSRFTTGSFTAGAAFVADLARLVHESGRRPPNVELRVSHIQLSLRSHDVGGVTEQDVVLARQISTLAAEHRLTPCPERVQVLELALDTPESTTVRPFWSAVLGIDTTPGSLDDPTGELPPLWFQTSDSTDPGRQRFHLDLTVPPDVAERRIAAAVSAGGRIVDDSRAPAFVVLCDPDGNNVCVCTELGRD